MRRAIVRLGCLCSLAFVAGCATGTGGNLPEQPRARQQQDYISTEEVRASNAVNAYEAISSLRAAWLRKRGEQGFSPTDVIVYYNNARMGGLESLRQISLGTVTWIRYFDARRAQYRYGSGHSQGAILVSSEIQEQAPPPPAQRRP
ncbi:MAG TPA: hypothetical protein VK358_02230 [Longimicrobium sp.]|jgi:hypothetical protein|nr:hypothetical protein [Longimicrobium sp.]